MIKAFGTGSEINFKQIAQETLVHENIIKQLYNNKEKSVLKREVVEKLESLRKQGHSKSEDELKRGIMSKEKWLFDWLEEIFRQSTSKFNEIYEADGFSELLGDSKIHQFRQKIKKFVDFSGLAHVESVD